MKGNYFARDCADIEYAATEDLTVFKRCAWLVLLSIRQPFEQMPVQMADVEANGRASRYLFGMKRDGFDWIENHAERLQNLSTAFDSLDAFILAAMECPGLGIAKASFLAQLTRGEGACLDSHNLERLGMNPDAFKTPKSLKLVTVQERVRSYNAVWRAHGDSAFWWNSWCDYVAERPRNRFKSGEEVSRLHRLVLADGSHIAE